MVSEILMAQHDARQRQSVAAALMEESVTETWGRAKTKFWIKADWEKPLKLGKIRRLLIG